MKKQLAPCIFLTLTLFVLTIDIQAQCISGNCINGSGKFKYPNGDVYEGEFKSGKKFGNGKMIFANGSLYSGGWLSDEMSTDTGKLVWLTKNRYEGAFAVGKILGKGKLYINDKLVREGSFTSLPGGSKFDDPQSENYLIRVSDGALIKESKIDNKLYYEINYPNNDYYVGSTSSFITTSFFGLDSMKKEEGVFLQANGDIQFGKWKNESLVALGYHSKLVYNDAAKAWATGLQRYSLKKYKEAIPYFSKAIQLSIKQDSIYFYRAVSYYQAFKTDSSLADWTTLQIKQPGNKTAYLQKAEIYKVRKDTASLLKEYTNYIGKFPNDSMGYWYRGIIYHIQMKCDLAISDYTKVINLIKGNYPDVYLNRAKCYEASGKLKEACNDYKSAKAKGQSGLDAKIQSICQSP